MNRIYAWIGIFAATILIVLTTRIVVANPVFSIETLMILAIGIVAPTLLGIQSLGTEHFISALIASLLLAPYSVYLSMTPLGGLVFGLMFSIYTAMSAVALTVSKK